MGTVSLGSLPWQAERQAERGDLGAHSSKSTVGLVGRVEERGNGGAVLSTGGLMAGLFTQVVEGLRKVPVTSS